MTLMVPRAKGMAEEGLEKDARPCERQNEKKCGREKETENK